MITQLRNWTMLEKCSHREWISDKCAKSETLHHFRVCALEFEEFAIRQINSVTEIRFHTWRMGDFIQKFISMIIEKFDLKNNIIATFDV